MRLGASGGNFSAPGKLRSNQSRHSTCEPLYPQTFPIRVPLTLALYGLYKADVDRRFCLLKAIDELIPMAFFWQAVSHVPQYSFFLGTISELSPLALFNAVVSQDPQHKLQNFPDPISYV